MMGAVFEPWEKCYSVYMWQMVGEDIPSNYEKCTPEVAFACCDLPHISEMGVFISRNLPHISKMGKLGACISLLSGRGGMVMETCAGHYQ